MKKLYTFLVAILVTTISFSQDLIITGVFDGPLSGGTPKVIELYAINDISDLSPYSVGTANNGGGTDGEEFTFPADAITAGDFIYLASEGSPPNDNPGSFQSYFGFTPNYIDTVFGINGDDAIELFFNGNVIDIFGEIDTDGTGEPWEYRDGWAYRQNATGPDGTTFVLGNWVYSGIDVNDDETNNGTAVTPFPITTYDPAGTPTPSLTITSPTNGDIFTEQDVTITFSVQNFVLGNVNSNGASAGADGHIHYSLDAAADVEIFNGDPIDLTGLSFGEHTFFMRLVSNSHNPLDPDVTATVTFEVQGINTVSNIAALRAGTIGQIYQLTGEVINTYSQDFRNQKWFQDGTGGILIDDSSGTLTTAYQIGDGVTGLIGILAEFNSVMQLQPTEDQGAVTSTGNAITTAVVTATELNANLEDYESELVFMSQVIITDIKAGDGTFQTGENYPLADQGGETIFRTNFFAADYIGTVLPSIPLDIFAIVGAFNDEAQVTSRSLEDFDVVLSTNSNEIEGFSIYPNPIRNGVLTIRTQNTFVKDVEIFTVLGKKVFAKNVTGNLNTINVSNLNGGLYLLKVTQGEQVSIQKIVVE
jgi:hypothetical protein